MLYQRKRKYISTGVKLYSDQWDARRLVINHPEMLYLNKRLLEQRQKIQDWLDGLARSCEEFEFDKLERFLDRRQSSGRFIDYVAARIDERTDIRDSTRKVQRKLARSLRDFGRIVYFTDLTRQNIMAYDEWLHARGYLQPTVHFYHKTLKTYIHDAIRAEIIDRSPYDGVKIDHGKSATRKYLTEAEVAAIAGVRIPAGRAERARDLFLFQCYTGFAYADLAAFDFSKAVERGGKYIIHGTRQKTGEPFYVVLLTPAVEKLKKYDFKLPVDSNQQYNAQLKAVATLAGMERGLTSHMARHTFAVMALYHGAKIENLAKMLGHTDIKTTQIYARVINTELEREFAMLERSLHDFGR